MLNPFEFGGFSLLPLLALCLLAAFVALALWCWGGFADRLSSEEKSAVDLGFQHGYQAGAPVEFESSGVELAYLTGYQAGSKQRQLNADRQKLKDLTEK